MTTLFIGRRDDAGLRNALPVDTLRARLVVAIIGWSLPVFVLGLVLLMVFYAQLDWFPPERLSGGASQVVQSGEFVRYTQDMLCPMP